MTEASGKRALYIHVLRVKPPCMESHRLSAAFGTYRRSPHRGLTLPETRRCNRPRGFPGS
jgi:hypothetical protein